MRIITHRAMQSLPPPSPSLSEVSSRRPPTSPSAYRLGPVSESLLKPLSRASELSGSLDGEFHARKQAAMQMRALRKISTTASREVAATRSTAVRAAA